MRLVIADDEGLLRYHLRSLVEEADQTAEILEAENGRELVSIVLRGDADAAFVDIRMHVHVKRRETVPRAAVAGEERPKRLIHIGKS